MDDVTEDALLEDSEDTSDDDVTDDEDETLQDDDEDPVALAIAAALEAEREKIRQEIEESAKLDREREQSEAALRRDREERESKLSTSFGDTVKEIRGNIKKLKVRDSQGNVVDVEVDDNFLEETLVKPLNKYNQSGLEAATLQIRQELSKAALETLPETERAEFSKRASDKEFDEWLLTHAEVYAPHSEYAKNLIKKYESEKKQLEAAAEARGFKKGQKSPPGSQLPSSTGAPKSNGKVDLTTVSGVAKAHANGDISNEKFLELWPKVTGGF